ncbi:MAG TPA: hypothetical protein VHX65_14125 [Pirellulales bacterium]|jgi:hypothetical protein|nr:hypothetical protein [Pirellulales bacterium]
MAMSKDFERALPTVQFRLRTMLLAVTACGACLAMMHVIGPVWSAILCILLLLAAGHVVGNVLGNRLRDEATAAASQNVGGRPVCSAVAIRPKPAKKLAVRAPLGRWISVLTLIGAVGGGTLGEVLFSGHAMHAALIVGSVSAAVIGGFAAFLAGSFFSVGLSAAWQAHCDKPAVPPIQDLAAPQAPARSISVR